MIIYSAALIIGFLVLFKSADLFVIGAVAIARNLQVSPVVIGLTIVALGTSAPEIFISAISSLEGQPQLAVGNAIGSNIANMGMVLGVTTLLVPLAVKTKVLRNDLPIMVFATFCAAAALIDLHLGFWDGLLLVSCLALFLVRLAAERRRSAMRELAQEVSELADIPEMSSLKATASFLIGLVFLLLSSEVLVWAVENIAEELGVSELVIGLTVIAIGTSLPELVVSLTSAFKGHAGLAIGNIIGSNIFNILAVLSIPCLLAPTELGLAVLFRDYGFMLLLTLLLAVFTISGRHGVVIGRFKGAILVCLWLGYLGTLYHSST